jgi:hypothetical protein
MVPVLPIFNQTPDTEIVKKEGQATKVSVGALEMPRNVDESLSLTCSSWTCQNHGAPRSFRGGVQAAIKNHIDKGGLVRVETIQHQIQEQLLIVVFDSFLQNVTRTRTNRNSRCRLGKEQRLQRAGLTSHPIECRQGAFEGLDRRHKAYIVETRQTVEFL